MSNDTSRTDPPNPLWERNWNYIKTIVDVVREPVLILDKDLCVLVANEPFYRDFQVESKDTEGKVVYELGNGQWNITALRKLLEDILPRNTFFKGFEVDHIFPVIGHRVIMLNARQIHFKEDPLTMSFPHIIFLAMEDVTDIMAIADTITSHTNQIEDKITSRTDKLDAHIGKLEKEIVALKIKSKRVL